MYPNGKGESRGSFGTPSPTHNPTLSPLLTAWAHIVASSPEEEGEIGEDLEDLLDIKEVIESSNR